MGEDTEVSGDTPTQPSRPTLRSLTEEDLRRALDHWLDDNPIPRSLHPLLEGVVLGQRDGRATRHDVPALGRLPSWHQSFALWASKTVEQAAREVWRAAYAEALSEEE